MTEVAANTSYLVNLVTVVAEVPKLSIWGVSVLVRLFCAAIVWLLRES